MKKILSALYFILMSLIILSLSGCGGGHNNDVINSEPDTSTSQNYEVQQVAVLSSPALEIHKDYKIFTSIDLEGMDTAQFYVSNIGDEASQTTLNLGLSESFDVHSTLAVINASTGAVIFAYNPSGARDTWKTGGNVFIRSNGKFMRYRTLSIDKTEDEPEDFDEEDEEIEEETQSASAVSDYPASNTNSNKYIDADVISSAYQTEHGTTSINIGTGSDVSFIKVDSDTRPRSVNISGDVFKLNREVNTFSGIIFK